MRISQEERRPIAPPIAAEDHAEDPGRGRPVGDDLLRCALPGVRVVPFAGLSHVPAVAITRGLPRARNIRVHVERAVSAS